MTEVYVSPYKYRCLSRIILEAVTPVAVGSGIDSILTDALVCLDYNGLPYIPGTSFTGVLRHLFAEDDAAAAEAIFGSKEKKKGSLFVCTDGKLLDNDGEVIDELRRIDFSSEYFKVFSVLPVRQHVKITHKGAAAKRNKFDEQLVPKGARFCFEMELLSKDENDVMSRIISLINSDRFTLGRGSRKGYGKFKVVSARVVPLCLSIPNDLERYLGKSSSLKDPDLWWKDVQQLPLQPTGDTHDEYKLELKGVDFVHFGSGHGDDEVDDTPLEEIFLKWDKVTEKFDSVIKTNHILPASSLKGVLSHRTAYYYNKTMPTREECKVGKENLAVFTLFGSEGNESGEGKRRGIVLFSDVIEESVLTEKIINHVSVSQFTGGALAGKLFDEKVVYCKDKIYTMRILVPKEPALDNSIINAFTEAMKDVCRGQLPLGGFVNRGHGSFVGKLFINGKEEEL